MPEILFITSYPPRECGIASYSQDLIAALTAKFKDAFRIKIAALENSTEEHFYNRAVSDILKTENPDSYTALSKKCNQSDTIQLILVQHEFGLFKNNEQDLIQFLTASEKPVIIALHTVLPNPDQYIREQMQQMDAVVSGFIVMTKSSAQLLMDDYRIDPEKITVIPHGTHLVKHGDKKLLKEKYGVMGRTILATFGLLSSGKSIETTLEALPAIAAENQDVLFLVIGKTHPSVVKNDGENYREFLQDKVISLQMQNHVKFVNAYLPLAELLDYLQLTDIYLFTSNDPNQAVSGTFSYALSCGCPIISTPIPHAREVLHDGSGIIIGFGDSAQLTKEVLLLLKNTQLRKNIAANGIHQLAPTAWENSAIAHMQLFKKNISGSVSLQYSVPEINLHHFKNMTTAFGMIQFAVINQPDIKTGYTIDDNARALVAICMHYHLKRESSDLESIQKYYAFIQFCQQKNGSFLNYVDQHKQFTAQNDENLEDSNGRAIWALGFMLSFSEILPDALTIAATSTMERALAQASKIYSSRAMAFMIKGIYYSNKNAMNFENIALIKLLANRLVQMYRHEATPKWKWFESYLTYGNSILPEALLCAYLATGELVYKQIAKQSFDFLLSKIFTPGAIKVISNKGWMQSNSAPKEDVLGGEQPIDVAYTILALDRFNDHFSGLGYAEKMPLALSWFSGNNHLNQIVYNPCTGGCYDGVEDHYINLNQGAESTVSYLMARLTMEKYASQKVKIQPLPIQKKTNRQSLAS
ncbi:glycosyl transferase [Flavobacterium noncentrifugens]|nr:glycosyl transferase [Flavobacterium noncentrifugens]